MMAKFQIEMAGRPKDTVIAHLKSRTREGALKEWRQYKQQFSGTYLGGASLKEVKTIARIR